MGLYQANFCSPHSQSGVLSQRSIRLGSKLAKSEYLFAFVSPSCRSIIMSWGCIWTSCGSWRHTSTTVWVLGQTPRRGSQAGTWPIVSVPSHQRLLELGEWTLKLTPSLLYMGTANSGNPPPNSDRITVLPDSAEFALTR